MSIADRVLASIMRVAGMDDMNATLKAILAALQGLSASGLPVIGGFTSLVAAEALAAGDIVNVFDNSGAANMQKANATDASKPAHGFVIVPVALGASGTMYLPGQIDSARAGLTPGVVYWLDVAGGGVTAVPPSTAGNLVQEVGVALSATKLVFSPKAGVQL